PTRSCPSRSASASPASSTSRRRARSRTPATSCRRTRDRRSARSSPSGWGASPLDQLGQLLVRALGEQADAAGGGGTFSPRERGRAVGAGRRAGVVEDRGEYPVAGVVEATATR